MTLRHKFPWSSMKQELHLMYDPNLDKRGWDDHSNQKIQIYFLSKNFPDFQWKKKRKSLKCTWLDEWWWRFSGNSTSNITSMWSTKLKIFPKLKVLDFLLLDCELGHVAVSFSFFPSLCLTYRLWSKPRKAML